MKLRRATADDAKVLLDWRNDPATRAASFQEQPITMEAHLTWLVDYLKPEEDSKHLFVAEADGLLVGTGRIDHDDLAWLSWTVASDHRGKGYGKRLVQALKQQAHELGYNSVGAKIRERNVLSQHLAYCADIRIIWILP